MAPRKHGHCTGGITKIYGAWQTMIGKCENPNHDRFKYYGARGIRVCERWHDFAKFLEDVGERPFDSASIDRINNDGNYELDNVRWATKIQQANNTRSMRLVTLSDGRRMSIAAAARETGISRLTLNSRVKKGLTGAELFRAATEPLKLDTPWGKLTVAETASRIGIDASSMNTRLARWPKDQWFIAKLRD